jgi:hypothetical protein
MPAKWLDKEDKKIWYEQKLGIINIIQVSCCAKTNK